LSVLTPLAIGSLHLAGTAYSWAYFVLGGLMAVTIVESLQLPRDAGSHVSRRED